MQTVKICAQLYRASILHYQMLIYQQFCSCTLIMSHFSAALYEVVYHIAGTLARFFNFAIRNMAF